MGIFYGLAQYSVFEDLERLPPDARREEEREIVGWEGGAEWELKYMRLAELWGTGAAAGTKFSSFPHMKKGNLGSDAREEGSLHSGRGRK